SKYIKKDEVVIEKPKIITNGEKFVEKNLIKLMIEDKKLRDIIVLKVNDNDFLLDESKEILNWIIKNQELDKITIDKIKSLNISEEYIKDIENISLNNMSLNNVKGVDDIIKNVKKNTLNEKMNRLLKEQKEIEKNKNNSDTKEVDGKIMEIALKIVEIRRMLQKL
ncbi:DNA primase, partial [Romboutsia sp. 1001216sp1]|nr:DNA primase [Romboutsia sp. 1001216sp1]